MVMNMIRQTIFPHQQHWSLHYKKRRNEDLNIFISLKWCDHIINIYISTTSSQIPVSKYMYVYGDRIFADKRSSSEGQINGMYYCQNQQYRQNFPLCLRWGHPTECTRKAFHIADVYLFRTYDSHGLVWTVSVEADGSSRSHFWHFSHSHCLLHSFPVMLPIQWRVGIGKTEQI